MVRPAQHLSAPMHVSEQYHESNVGRSLDRWAVIQADGDILDHRYFLSLAHFIVQNVQNIHLRLGIISTFAHAVWASALSRWYHGIDPAKLIVQHSLSPPKRK